MSIEKFLKNKGIAKNKKQANFIMIMMIIICIIIIIMTSRKDSPKTNFDETVLSPEEIELMELEPENFEEDIL
ncbi:MAG: hypothetical protein LR005_01860 [Candidatus Pacebacteria bacterium]|nr:hypothetical protein [Candidatus Paceibacterota bacterium]